MDRRALQIVLQQSGLQYQETLFRLLRQPSISTQGIGVEECGLLLQTILEEIGFKATLYQTAGYPIVYAEYIVDDARPTVLFYGHYDVQPPEPIEAWQSDPFEPEIRDGRIFARGAGDNKGQFLAHALAVQGLLEAGMQLPVNVKFIIEGEEENGSPHIDTFVAQNRSLLRADLVYTSDGSYHSSNRPTIYLGVRGMLCVELIARGADRDLHSGNWGNIAPNPAWKLVAFLGRLYEEGRVQIPGFYDHVRVPTDYELALLKEVPFDSEQLAKSLGLPEAPVKSAGAFARRLMFEPTCNVFGIKSGYDGVGIKTIIPSEARAKIDFRLVMDQDPDEIARNLTRFVAEEAPDVQVIKLGTMRPSRTSAKLPIIQRVIRAVARVRGEDPVVLPSLGGSLPDSVWTQTLGAPSVLVPYANPDENNHAPNENLEVQAFYRGIETTAHVLLALGSESGTHNSPEPGGLEQYKLKS